MQKPIYKIKIGSNTFDVSTDKINAALSINVDCDLNIPLDAFKIVFKANDNTGAIKAGDDVTIELGYDPEKLQLKKVFTGKVDNVEKKLTEVTVAGFSLASDMTKKKVHQVYEKQSAGLIVKDLASKAKVKVKDADDGISFPMYTVDDTKPIYGHMRELAGLCGFDVFMSIDGEVVFKKYKEGKPSELKYGVNVIDIITRQRTPEATSVKVYEESPASTKGSDKSHWLSKSPMGGSAGLGDLLYTVWNPAIKDKGTADTVAKNKKEQLSVSMVGTVRALGDPAIVLGSTIEIKDMPDKSLNGKYEVTGVSHVFSMIDGFVTTVGWAKKGKGESTPDKAEGEGKEAAGDLL